MFVILLAAVVVYGFPSGAPPSACISMMPGHGIPPQNSPCPFYVIPEKSNLKGGQSMNITIQGQNDETFKGYLLQARTDDTPIGTFSVSGDEGTVIDCGEGKENAVTHSNPNDKKEVTVTWTAPEGFNGQTVMYLTIVKDFHTFWVQEKSAPVIIS